MLGLNGAPRGPGSESGGASEAPAEEEAMYSESLDSAGWRERAERVFHAAFVVACYLIIFAGLLYSVASQAGAP